MACRVGFYVVCVLCCALMLASEAAYIPKTRGLVSAEALKRSVQTGARQKRYTDYQERASAFCTGLCMYEERKSYSDCFDLCNWKYGHSSDYDQTSYDTEPQTAPYTAPESSITDTDYSNDEAMRVSNSGKSKSSKKQRKGKKGKGKSTKTGKAKVEGELVKQKQILKELRRKLMQEIKDKHDQLSNKAVDLEKEIMTLEAQIDINKQTIGDLQDRLGDIGDEMENIEELKSNISMVVKDRRKMLSGKTSDGFSESFLVPESQFSNEGNLSNVLKDFLVQDTNKRASEEGEIEWSGELGPLSLYKTGVEFVPKGMDLRNAASNLKDILSAEGYRDDLL